MAAFFGGPIAAGYVIADNFKSFGEQDKVFTTWLSTILVTILIVALAVFMPGIEKVPGFFIPILYGAIASFTVQRFQSEKIKKHNLNGGRFYSVGRVILISVIGFVITIGVFLLIGSLFDMTRLFQ